MMGLADRLQELMDAKGYSSYKVSRYTGVHQSTLSRILRSETTNIQDDTLIKIANYLQTTVEYLKTGDESKKSITAESSDINDVIKFLMEQNATLRKSIEELKAEITKFKGIK